MKTKTKQALRLAAAGLAVSVLLSFIIPAPLWGYWHTPLSECNCPSKNLIAFDGGVAYQWNTAHLINHEEIGRYKRRLYWVELVTDDGLVELRPNWLFMIIKKPDSKDGKVKTKLGYLAVNPLFVWEVLLTKK